MILNKIFHPTDYEQLGVEVRFINTVLSENLGGKNFDLQHEHRRWEYAMALRALTELGPMSQSILDIGSFCSPFPAVLKMVGYDVTGSDLCDRYGEHDLWPFDLKWINLRKAKLKEGQFDVVTAISVIEHIVADTEALEVWWGLVRRGMFISFDASSDGRKLVDHHHRTYTMEKFIDMVAALPDSRLVAEIDLGYPGDLVPPGNFGCVTIERIQSNAK